MKKLFTLLICLLFFTELNIAQTPTILAKWNGGNTSTIIYPYFADNKEDIQVITSASLNYNGLNTYDDNRHVYESPNTNATLNINTAPYLSILLTLSGTGIEFDRFVIPGLAMGVKLQLRWSEDGFSNSLGEFTSDEMSYTLSSVDLSGLAEVNNTNVEFRIYFYNGASTAWMPGSTGNPSIDGTPSFYGDIYAGISIWYKKCLEPDEPTITATRSVICEGESTEINVVSGNLNDATEWKLYSEVCGGTLVDANSTGVFTLTPATSTTYYIRGEGGCATAENCGSVDITVNSSTTNTISETTCDKYTVPSGDEFYTVSGTYIDTISNSAGCDSIITINLTIINSTTSTITETACDIYTVPSGDETYFTNGTYIDTISNSAGCDSVITINLTIINSTTSTITETACDSYTVPSGDETYFTNGTYMDTIPNYAGCDSIITINLFINSTASTITETACDSYTVPSGNKIYTVSGTYTDTIPNEAGCDSIITINLIVNPTYHFSDTVIINSGESHTYHDGIVATVSGSHTSILNTINGCDSLITTSLTVATFIPDANFEQALIDLGYDTGEINGYVCADSINIIDSLNIENRSIRNLTGIEDFSALKTLICNSNQLSNINISSNTSLINLSCSHNQLSSLDINSNKELLALNCDFNQLSNINLNLNTALTTLSCNNNQLTSIDVSMIPYLTFLHCNYNQLTNIDLSANLSLTNLSCSNNQLTSLDVSANTLIDVLDCNNNPFTSINVGGLRSLTDLNCSAGELVSIDLTGATSLTTLNCDSNKIVTLDLTGAQALTNLSCNSNQIENLYISGATSLNQLNCSLNKLVNLDASGATSLTHLTCNSNQLENLDISGATSISELDCSLNKLVNLDVSGATSLVNLSCTSNQLENLNISGASSLTTLDCSQNSITSLVLGEAGKGDLESLVELDCSNNYIDSLDVSGAAKLARLFCNDNNLVSLIILDSNLEKLNCSYNELRNLDVSKAASLTKLNCRYNNLKSLILVDSNSKDEVSLEELDCSYNDLEELATGGGSKSNSDLLKLNCSNNKIESINVSDAISLNTLDCSSNRIVSLNVRNGNNLELTYCNVTDNSDSLCIEVDDELAANSGTGSYCDWNKDASAYYSEDCSGSVLGIDEFNNLNQVLIYPNPSNNLFNIELGQVKDIDHIVVTDISGRVVYQVKNLNNEKVEVDLSNNTKGIYILTIKRKTELSNYKLIKQ